MGGFMTGNGQQALQLNRNAFGPIGQAKYDAANLDTANNLSKGSLTPEARSHYEITKALSPGRQVRNPDEDGVQLSPQARRALGR